LIGYYGLRYFVYIKINEQLQHKVQFNNIDIGIFPLSIKVRDLKELAIKEKNIISFKQIGAEMSLFDLFSADKEVNIFIHQPKIRFDNSLFKSKGGAVKSGPFKINRVNIIDGELVYNTPTLYGKLHKFDLKSFPGKETAIYRLTSPHLKVQLPLSSNYSKDIFRLYCMFPFNVLTPVRTDKLVSLEGQVVSEIRKQKNGWKISKFYWETEKITFNANGRVFPGGKLMFNIFAQRDIRQFLDPLLGSMTLDGFVYGNARIKKLKGKRLTIEGDFSYNSVTIAGESFKNLKGKATWDNMSKRLKVIADMQDGKLNTHLEINKLDKPIIIEGRNLSARKLGRMLLITKFVPLDGIIDNGMVEINGRQFNGNAHLSGYNNTSNGNVNNSNINNSDVNNDDIHFNATGTIDFEYNSKSKNALITTKDLKTEFGTINRLKAVITPSNRTQLNIQTDAVVNQAGALDKYTQYYINLPLTRWSLDKGDGAIRLDLQRVNNVYIVESDIRLNNFGIVTEKIQSVNGRILTDKGMTTGKFLVLDPQVKGNIDFTYNTRGSELIMDFTNLRGESKKVLNILEIDLSLYGAMKGDFRYTSRSGMKYPLVTGSFNADSINFYDFIFEKVKGDMEYSDSITLKNLEGNYMSGKGQADVFINYYTRRFNVKGNLLGIDFNRMNSQFTGIGDVFFEGEGAFDTDPIHLRYKTGPINFYKDQSFSVNGDGKLFTDFSNYRFKADGKIESDTSVSPASLQLEQTDGVYTGKFQANIRDINLLIPWGDNKGEVRVNGRIFSQPNGSISAEGHADFNGKYLSFPNFPHSLDNFSGDLLFKDLDFTLRSIEGFMGGGKVEGSGRLIVVDNKLDTLHINADGKEMTLHLMDRTSVTLDGDLGLKYDKNRQKLMLSGELNVSSGLWERELDEGISFNTNPSLSASGSRIMDMLEYDLKMVTRDSIRFNNAFGQGEGTFNLQLTGDVDFPVLIGVIESKKGFVNFSGKKFDLLKGRVVFNDKFRNDPMINIETEAFIKNYRIKFTARGKMSRMKPELQSSPPLPPRDILTLIAVGELFQRPTSTELSSQFGTGTTDLIASELTEQIQKRTKKIFGDYMLKLDPNINSITTGTSMDASRLIVGKEISKDFIIVYSTNFSTTQRQQVVYLQYQLTPSISLIGMRNEEGLFSFDIRYRKRH
jgi:hypothetical protein